MGSEKDSVASLLPNVDEQASLEELLVLSKPNTSVLTMITNSSTSSKRTVPFLSAQPNTITTETVIEADTDTMTIPEIAIHHYPLPDGLYR